MTALNKQERDQPGTTLEKDGFHLTKKAGEQIAHILAAHIEGKESTTPPSNTSEDRTNLTIPEDIAKHIVGKGGKRLKEITEKFDIKIGKDHDQQDNLILTLIGKPQEIKSATEFINNIIAIQYENQRAASQHKNDHPGEICKFYTRYGKCKYGPNCWYEHPTAPSNLTPDQYTPQQNRRQEQHSTHRSRSPIRTHRPRSKTRHHSTQNRSASKHNSHSRTPRDYHRDQHHRATNHPSRNDRHREPERPPLYHH